jgi:choline dehydrogenase-like flavoprotein
MSDPVIVGSGVAGVGAALALIDKGFRPRMLDVGLLPREEPDIKRNLYEYCDKRDSFPLLIGEEGQGLYNMDPAHSEIPAKLTSPRMQYVTERSGELGPVEEVNFDLIQSFALGGLANAWGAALYRYLGKDLDGFPIREADLRPYYDRLVREIGISGENDELSAFFGRDGNLQKPLRLSANAALLLKKYRRNRDRLNKRGVFIGRPRLGVLSEEKDGRSPCDYSNLEFWQKELPWLYTPVKTLKRLVREKKIFLENDVLVKGWKREGGKIVVFGQRTSDGASLSRPCSALFLAAGAANSAKIVLTSRNDTSTRLVLLDNPAIQFPFIFPARIGARLETQTFGLTQLNFIQDGGTPRTLIQGSILEVTSPARAEFFSSFPLSASDNFRLLRFMLPAVLVMQLFLPSFPDEGALLGINKTGGLVIEGQRQGTDKRMIKSVIKTFRTMGAYTLPPLVVETPNGHGIHYAGTLPMTEKNKNPYTCSRFGQLAGEPDVYVADGSSFPVLPAKNCSFAVMANAMRIADLAAERLKGMK